MIKKFAERNNVVNEAKMPTVSKELVKATEKMHAEQLKQQELQKKFVSETDPDKKEKMKADLVAQHKKVKEAERNFQEALGREEVDYDDSLLENKIVSEEDAAKEAVTDSLKELQDEFSGNIDDIFAYLESTIEDYEEHLSPETLNYIDDLINHMMGAQVSLVKAIASLRK
jgi:hypothetical protein